MDLDEMIKGVSKIASSEQYSKLTNALRDKANDPPGMAFQDNQNVIDQFPLPQVDGLRVSPRIFEPEDSPTTALPMVDMADLDGTAMATYCASIGVIVCGSVGVEMMDGVPMAGDPVFPPAPDPVPGFPAPDPVPLPLEDYSYDFVRSEFDKVKAVAESAPFQAALDELYALPVNEQSKFVKDNILNNTKREERGIVLGDDVNIMRSAFADGRPTLFALVSKLPDGKKLTITYDQPSD